VLAFISHGTVRNYAEPKPCSWAKPANIGWYSSSNFTVRRITYRAPLEMVRCKKIVACNFGTPPSVRIQITWTCHICSLDGVVSASWRPEWTTSHQWTSWPFCPLDWLRFFIQCQMGFITVLFFFWLLTIVLFFFSFFKFFCFATVFPLDLTSHLVTLLTFLPS